MERKLVSRRTVLKSAAGAAATLLPPMLNLGRFQTHAQGRTYSARAIDLVGRSLVIDMLSLLHPLDSLYPQSAQQNPLELSAEQLAKLRSGGVNVFHPAIGVSGPQAKTRALRFVAGLNSVVAEYSGYLRRVDSAADLQGIEDSDKMGVIIGIQNSDHFRTLEDVNQFYHLGQRVSQLTYNRRNLLGTGKDGRTGRLRLHEHVRPAWHELHVQIFEAIQTR